MTPTDSALTVTVSVEEPTCQHDPLGQSLVHVELEDRQRGFLEAALFDGEHIVARQ